MIYVRKSHIRLGLDLPWPMVDLILDYRDLIIRPGSNYKVSAIPRPDVVRPGVYAPVIEPLPASSLYQIRVKAALYFEFPRLTTT